MITDIHLLVWRQGLAHSCAKLSTFHLKTETECSLRNVMF
jgi:hypothetical protein